MVRQRTSKDTAKASESLMALDTIQSPRFSISWMVRLDRPDKATNCGTDKPFSNLIFLRFIVGQPFWCTLP